LPRDRWLTGAVLPLARRGLPLTAGAGMGKRSYLRIYHTTTPHHTTHKHNNCLRNHTTHQSNTTQKASPHQSHTKATPHQSHTPLLAALSRRTFTSLTQAQFAQRSWKQQRSKQQTSIAHHAAPASEGGARAGPAGNHCLVIPWPSHPFPPRAAHNPHTLWLLQLHFKAGACPTTAHAHHHTKATPHQSHTTPKPHTAASCSFQTDVHVTHSSPVRTTLLEAAAQQATVQHRSSRCACQRGRRPDRTPIRTHSRQTSPPQTAHPLVTTAAWEDRHKISTPDRTHPPHPTHARRLSLASCPALVLDSDLLLESASFVHLSELFGVPRHC
jgi:hypothetical protein